MVAILNKLGSFIGLDTVEEDDFEDVIEQTSRKEPEKVVKLNEFKNKNAQRTTIAASNPYEIEHIIIAPKAFDDAKRIADEIKAKKMVTMNMAMVSFEEARRILDFISGTAYAVDSKITKISDHVFISVSSRVKQINELPSKDREQGEVLKDKDREKYEFYGSPDDEEIRRVMSR